MTPSNAPNVIANNNGQAHSPHTGQAHQSNCGQAHSPQYSNTLVSKNNRALLLLSACFMAMVAFLHAPLLIWVIVIAVCAMGIRIAFYLGWHTSTLRTRTINLLALLSLLALGWFGPSIGLLNAMINLLVIACSLKLMLLNQRKDFLQLFSACLFLIGCGFIFALSIAAWIGFTLILGMLFSALASLFAPSVSIGNNIKKTALVLLQAFPIAAIMFVVVPHFPPLWQMPVPKSSHTGLAEKVTPGDIASLAKSSELAFSATFSTAPPPPIVRYWRAMTMEQFDGKTWTVSKKRKQAEQQLIQLGKQPNIQLPQHAQHYQLIVEPHNKTWLYSLDVSAQHWQAGQQDIARQFDYSLKANAPVISKRAYYLSYYPNEKRVSQLPVFDTQLNLLYPINSNPRTQAWAAQLQANSSDEMALAMNIMNYFQRENFVYTLTPNAMPDAPIDTFLFEAKAGFCTHYASAMAFALRVAGVPARLVTGYQGGELLSENVLQIRQYDAHAWVEALINGEWISFDPTSVVAPSRLTLGLQQTLNGSEKLSSFHLVTSLQQWFRQLNYQWSRLILGFDNKNQTDILKKLLGTLTPQKITVFFLAALVIIAMILLAYFFPFAHKKALPKHKSLYLKAANHVAAYTGISRGTLGASAYFTKVTPYLSNEASAQFNIITQQFEALNYQKPNTASEPNASVSSSSIMAMKVALKTLLKNLKKLPKQCDCP